jgi:GNAT superfamily N-acetyltransferase
MLGIGELIGYGASILVAASLAMKNILRLRLINLLGAIAFTIYGLLIHAYPVAIVNSIIIGINLYYLYMILTKKDIFQLQIMHADSEFLEKFLFFYQKDIQRYFPRFTKDFDASTKVIMTFRNLTAVGVFIYRIVGNQVEILVDYVTPEYRDFKNARFLYAHLPDLLHEDPAITELHLWTVAENPHLIAFLTKMGFIHDRAKNSGHYSLSLAVRK